MNERTKRTIDALRTPDASLKTCPNTVRQSIADVIEDLQKQVDKYGLALMMIREGCADPRGFAAEILEKAKQRS